MQRRVKSCELVLDHHQSECATSLFDRAIDAIDAVIQLPHADRDMAENAKYGVSYDGKEKFILDHGLVVMVFSTTKPGAWLFDYCLII